MKLMANEAFVLTDSGGIQEETTILGVPCLALRENTKRPVTVTEGTDKLVKLPNEDILAAYYEMRTKQFNMSGRILNFWDGKAARRIADGIVQKSNSYQGIYE